MSRRLVERKTRRNNVVCNIARFTIGIMWILSFFSVNKLTLGEISFKQALGMVVVYTFFLGVNWIILEFNKREVRKRCYRGNL